MNNSLLNAKKVATFQQNVLHYYQTNGRKNLPWHKNPNPYRVWLSEIMLQQTQVKTVIPYYQKFTRQLPNVKQLALAEEDLVMHLWSGLGYYSRARNLHKTAKIVYHEYKGRFPKNITELESLPGIGRSTAGAIVSFAFQDSAAILDGNVKRVLCRHFAVEGWPGKTQVLKKLWQLSENLTPKKNCNLYNQAMMDIGAIICTRNPNCLLCPLEKTCAAYQQDNVLAYPGKKNSKPKPLKKAYMLILENKQGEVYLQKRPPTGIWGGLWGFPQLEIEGNELKSWCKNELNIDLKNAKEMPSFTHTFSHFQLLITPIKAKVKQNAHQVSEKGLGEWFDPINLPQLGLAAPVSKILRKLEQR